MIWVSIFITISYVLLIASLVVGFRRVAEFKPKRISYKTKFSIIIPFRNEAENLPVLLKSIAELNYNSDFFEVIFVDDASEDNSVQIITDFFNSNGVNIETHSAYKPSRCFFTILKNNIISNSPKKDAITTAIPQTKYGWIITTDADCKLPKNWLKTLDEFIQSKNPKMVVAPVNYEVDNSFLEGFQLLDFMSMQGATIGGFGINNPFMSNGANLAYRKEVFLQLDGFDGNNHIASGDDVFLFEKFLIYDKKSVCFLKSKEAIVNTFPVKSWGNLVEQRVRWASKASKFNSVWAKLVGLLVFMMNVNLVIAILLAIFQIIHFKVFLALFAIKSIVDLFLFLPTLKFYNQLKNFIKVYLLSSLLYPFFSVFVVFYSWFFKFRWKGRGFEA